MRIVLVLLVVVSGCQCLEPVSESGETPDAGERCKSDRDCAVRIAPRSCGGDVVAPTRSCFNERCVFDCEGPRTCSTVDGCTSCVERPSICNMDGCNLFDETAAGRITRSCASGSTEALGNFVARFHNPSACGYDVFFADGRAFGYLAMADEFDEAVARVNSEPDVTCTVRGLPTAINRLELGCADCLYVLEWP